MSFFREILTVIAGLLVLLLTAALAGPYFVDWTAHRAAIEETLSKAAGAPVRVAGDIDLKLLPTPRLVLGKVGIRGGSPGTPSVEAQRVVAELAVMPLLRGDLRFTEAQIENPVVTLFMNDEGGFAVPQLPVSHPQQVAFENIAITNARIVLMDVNGAQRASIGNVSLEAAAQALTGPWRGTATLPLFSQNVTFYFNTSVIEDGRMRIKAAVDRQGLLPRTEIEGTVSGVGAEAGSVKFSFEGQSRLAGHVTFPGEVEAPWTASGPLKIDAAGIAFDPFELKAGSEDRTQSATGKASYIFGTTHAQLEIETAQIDADRLASAGDDKSVAMRMASDWFEAASTGALTLPPVQISLKSPALTIGGETLTNTSLTLSRTGERNAQVRLSAGLPGRSSVDLDGTVETGPAARFQGNVDLRTRDLPQVSQWIARGSEKFAAQLKALPFSQLEIAGTATLSNAGFFGRDLKIVADRSQFAGLVSVTRAIGADRTRIALYLDSPSLDLDHLPDLSPLAGPFASADFSIALNGRAVRLARFGQGMIDAGRIAVRVKREGGELTIERFDIAGLGGANVSAQGKIAGASGRIDIDLDAQRLVELAELLQRVAPGAWSDALARRAVALSPAKLTFGAATRRGAHGIHLASLSLKGTARGTSVEGRLAPEDNAREAVASLSLSNPQTPMLLRQLGVETIALDRLPEGRIEIEARGNEEKGFATKLRSTLAGVASAFDGHVRALLPQPDIEGKLTVSGKDMSALLQVLAFSLPDVNARAPLEASAKFAWRENRIALDNIEAAAFGARVTGRLSRATNAPDAIIAGALHVDTLALEALTSLALGPTPPAKKGEVWSSLSFAPSVSPPPAASIAVTAGAIGLAGDLRAENARFQLTLAPGLVSVGEVSAKAAGGIWTGRASLRRNRANAAVSGQLTYAGPVEGLGGITGEANGTIDFAGTGPSLASVVSGLAGRGKIEIRGVRIRNADPAALARVIAGAGDTLDISQARIGAALEKELGRGDRRFARISGDLSLAGGQIRFEPSNGQAVQVAASIDLRAMTMDMALNMEARAPEGWKGPAPQAGLRWQGPLRAPERSLSIASLVNALSARAIEREAERIELLEFDARERAAFNRRNRTREFLQQRAVEIAAYAAEQERLAKEAARRAEEDARRKQLEEQQAAARAKKEKERAPAPRILVPPRPAPNAGPLQLVPQTPAPTAPR